MAADRKMFRRLIGRIRRFESLTGRKIGRGAFQSLMEAELTTSQARAEKTAEFKFRKEQETTRRGEFERTEGRLIEEGKKAARGARLKGATSLATTSITVAESKTGQALGEAGRRVIGRYIPSLAVGSAAGAGTIGTEAGVLYGAEAAGGGAGAGTVAPGIASTAAPAIAGYAGSEVGKALFGGEKGLIGKGKATQRAGSIAGGAAAGAIAGAKFGSIIPGPGTVIGAVIGGVVGAVNAGTVICTELYVQGYIPLEILLMDDHTKHEDLDDKVYNGYMRWSPYVVSAMQKSKIVTWLVKPFGVGWAYHMAHRLDENVPDSWIGKALHKVGVPVCRWLGRKEVS